MPVTIKEITTEIVLEPEPADERRPEAAAAVPDDLEERIVRRAVERVLARLRLEWER